MHEIFKPIEEAFSHYFTTLDLSRLTSWLTYRPEAPMIFSSALFLLLFLFFFPIYYGLRRQYRLRILFVSLFSLYFYYKSGGYYFILLLLMVTSDFLIGKQIAKATSRLLKKRWLTLSVVIDLSVLAFFKYFNFLADAFINLALGLAGLIGYDQIGRAHV